MRQNLGLQILSLVIAVFLWAFVRVTHQGSFQTEAIAQITLDLPLQLQGKEPNLIPYEYSADRVRVTLRGKPDVVQSLREGLVKAYINLAGLVEGTHVPEVKVLAPPDVQVIDKEPASVTLKISPLVGKNLPVNIIVTGAPAEGMVVGTAAVEPSEVKLRGPAALLAEVVEVKGQVALNGQSQAYSVEVADLRPVNENGTVVQGTNYPLALRPASVTVTVPIEARGSSIAVPVEVHPKADNLVHFTVEPEYVTVRVAEGGRAPRALSTEPVSFGRVTTRQTRTVRLVPPAGVEILGQDSVVVEAIPSPEETPGL
ncbi:MAG: hypothetical protein HY319_09680 [Armatimonadetes bacterium]|nr:hypothetical protein [Armatimonadota bacterium]